MTQSIKTIGSSKREMITYLVLFLWIYLGIIASYFHTDFTNLSAYFISLTGFIGSYIFGETKRRSTESSIIKRGKSSRREVLTYIIILIWSIVGTVVIYNGGDLIGASAYFAALTPFVGSYIIGETYKSDEDHEDHQYNQINS